MKKQKEKNGTENVAKRKRQKKGTERFICLAEISRELGSAGRQPAAAAEEKENISRKVCNITK